MTAPTSIDGEKWAGVSDGRGAGVVVRRAGAGDFEPVRALSAVLVAARAIHNRWIDPGWPRTPDGEAWLRAHLTGDEDKAVFLADLGRAGVPPVGFVIGSVRRDDPQLLVPWGHLHQILVTPERRARGVGTALLCAYARWAYRRGACAFDVDAFTSDLPVARFYERAGMTPMITRFRGPLPVPTP